MINPIAEYKKETGQTLQRIGYLLGIHFSKVSLIVRDKVFASNEELLRLEKIKEYERLILENEKYKKEMQDYINNYPRSKVYKEYYAY